MTSPLLGLAMGVAASLPPSVARAAAPAPAIRLEYRASRRCPSQTSFMARVAKRVSGIRLAAEQEEARTFVVSLDSGPPATGSVSTVDQGGVRRVRAGSCEQVADALALVVALAIEPPEDAAADSPAPPAPAPSPPAPPPTAAATAAAAAKSASVRPKIASASPRSWAFFAGADAGYTGSLGPDNLFGAAPFFGWVDEGSRRLMLRASVFRTTGSRDDVPGVTSESFVWTVGRLDACRLLVVRRPLRLGLCGEVEAGALEVRAAGSIASVSQTHPWLALGPALRFELRVFGPIFLSTGVALMFRATPDHFVLGAAPSGGPTYDVPLYGEEAELGLGAHFL